MKSKVWVETEGTLLYNLKTTIERNGENDRKEEGMRIKQDWGRQITEIIKMAKVRVWKTVIKHYVMPRPIW